MLELATLGLLQNSPLHGYRLKQQLELFMSGCISVNYGAIYPLLRRLEEQKAILAIEEPNNQASGQNRRVYSITESGRIRWKQKMLEHPHESWVHARSRFAIKFFFFRYLEPRERMKLLEHRLMACQLRLQENPLEIFPEDSYQTASWQRCREIIANEIEWLNGQLEAEKLLLARQPKLIQKA